ncbi:hypothetical protein [Burkholderia sp. JKS000303]|uniref:hypothetical protein n=1 Tax=Burkholderia sp. JKS000303 TaxID=1938747 RepID=UPI000BF3FD96|nr:hypothetical protein [Burkholderia sp. JKS000303]PFH12913.1 hypothetical protein BX604_7333 [Burkholderia sp. JKS000303]
MIQLSFSDWHPRRKNTFGARACRRVRERILAGAIDTLPRTWQRKWIIQRIVATPPWADMRAIRTVYDEAARLTFETGVFHEVDHIVPLNHPRVCGLHVHWNLRAIPAGPNNAKGNTWCPEQLELDLC